MSGRPRKGRPVIFASITPEPQKPDPVLGLKFTIEARYGGTVLVDMTRFNPRPLAIAFAGALRRLAALGGPLRYNCGLAAIFSSWNCLGISRSSFCANSSLRSTAFVASSNFTFASGGTSPANLMHIRPEGTSMIPLISSRLSE